jgi:hypothetical protein
VAVYLISDDRNIIAAYHDMKALTCFDVVVAFLSRDIEARAVFLDAADALNRLMGVLAIRFSDAGNLVRQD